MLISHSVALVTLSADSLHELLPAQDANSYKIWGALMSVSHMQVDIIG
jgi:hypothetical protein